MPARERLSNRKQPEEEYSLIAHVKSVTASYYISTHGGESDSSTDEAIAHLLAEIVMTKPKLPKHLGRDVSCSLMCSRIHHRSDANAAQVHPVLLYIRLKPDLRLFSAYLPTDVFLAVQTDLKSGQLKYVEARFNKPRYGSGKLVRLYFSDTQPEVYQFASKTLFAYIPAGSSNNSHSVVFCNRLADQGERSERRDASNNAEITDR